MVSRPSLVILKIGGSVITDRRQERPVLFRSRLERIAREIATAWRSRPMALAVIHGAGSFGHPIVRRTGINRGISNPAQRVAMGETQRLQSWMNTVVVRHLLRSGLPAFPLQASASAVMEAGRLVSMDTQAIRGLLETGLIPVLCGVPAFDQRQGCSILSGDQIASFLFTHLEAEQVLHGTNVRGVFTADPFQDPAARFIELIDLDSSTAIPAGVGGSAVTDVTGGLRKKLEELAAVGASGQIFDATQPGNVERALMGEIAGTEVRCRARVSSLNCRNT